MAIQDKEEDLISYLKSLGFEGDILEMDVRIECKEFKGRFTIYHRIPFGEEMMRYELNFIYDKQFEAYRLINYLAAHRSAVEIHHKTINGIDSAELEGKMASIDWDRYFHFENNELPPDLDLKPLFDQLWGLSTEDQPDPEGEAIQSLLMFKYWPYQNWMDEAQEQQHKYETSQTFIPTYTGICNAKLAYEIVSGRFDRIYDPIAKTGIEGYSELDLKNLLCFYLSREVEQFEVSCSRQVEQGIVDFSIPVHLLDGEYKATIIQASFTYFPEIVHGSFNGIDTAELNDQMRLIDWKNGDLYYLNEVEDVVLYPYVQTIKEKIEQLISDENTKNIAEFLQVKYWSDSFMDMYVDDEVWKMKDWKSVNHRFKTDEDIRTIANLMQGHPVHSSMLKITPSLTEGWCALDPSSLTENGLNPISYTSGVNREQIETMIGMLPHDGTVWIGDIVRSIQQGEKVPVNLVGISGEQQIMVSMPRNPQEERLELMTTDGRSIAFNFRFDPDWTIDKLNAVKTQNVKQPAVNEKPAGNNKKKGKRLRK